jgi:hypothetical protein
MALERRHAACAQFFCIAVLYPITRMKGHRFKTARIASGLNTPENMIRLPER